MLLAFVVQGLKLMEGTKDVIVILISSYNQEYSKPTLMTRYCKYDERLKHNRYIEIKLEDTWKLDKPREKHIAPHIWCNLLPIYIPMYLFVILDGNKAV